MKVAILSESTADEAAIRILIDQLLGHKTEAVVPHRMRSRGWPYTRQVLPAFIKYLHYRTDADAFAVVVDSDDSPVHEKAHEASGKQDERCRLCQLRARYDQVVAQLKPIPNRSVIKAAIGLAVPAIEAWLLCDKDPHVSEAAWVNGMKQNRPPYTRPQLKQSLYGSDRPPHSQMLTHMTKAAQRLTCDMVSLEGHFPAGFGVFASQVRDWTRA